MHLNLQRFKHYIPDRHLPDSEDWGRTKSLIFIKIKPEVQTEIKAENKAETVETVVREEEDALAASRVLWISGLDRTMKANDFRVAFSPFGRGTAIVQSPYLRV